MSGTTAGGYAGVATALAGTAQQFYGASQSANAAKQVQRAAKAEAQATLLEGDQQAQAAQKRAQQALEDIAFLDATTAAQERFLDAEGQAAIGLVEAQAAASGVTTAGSPLLHQFNAAYAVETRKANVRLSQLYGTRRFLFEAETELKRAQDVKDAAKRVATGQLGVRVQQAAQLRSQAVRSILAGAGSLTDTTTVKNAAELYRQSDIGGSKFDTKSLLAAVNAEVT